MKYTVTKQDKQYRGHVVRQNDWELTDLMTKAEALQFIENNSSVFSGLEPEEVWY